MLVIQVGHRTSPPGRGRGGRFQGQAQLHRPSGASAYAGGRDGQGQLPPALCRQRSRWHSGPVFAEAFDAVDAELPFSLREVVFGEGGDSGK
ncbi:hypothetical protein, partial [Streptomyces sp. NPDC001155]